MFDLNGLQAEINELKAQTLSQYGKKIEFAIEMIQQKSSLLKREQNILLRLQNREKFKKGLFAEKRRNLLIDRVSRKIERLKNDIKRLEELKVKYIEDYKKQREFLGLYDHQFIDNFYD
ncbi:MAG: hypothetical protein K6348_06820 [Deferribacterales bacterium]